MRVINASDLARNTSAILERVLTGETVSVMRNRTEVAHIVPAKRSMTAAQAIAGLEGKLPRPRAIPGSRTAVAHSMKRFKTRGDRPVGMIFDTLSG